MSRRDDDRLDSVIDRVAHDLTTGELPAGLAEHVRARIATRRRSGRPERESKGAGRDDAPGFLAWRPVTAMAALVIVTGLAVALWPARRVDVPVVADQGSSAGNGGSASASIGTTADLPEETPDGQTQAARVRRGGLAAPTRLAGDGPIAEPPVATLPAGTLPAATPLPAIEPLAVPAIEDPVLVAEMTGLAMPIVIVPLQIRPLDVVTAADAGL